MKLTESQLAALARTIADTADEEYNCEQMLAHAAKYVESVINQGQAHSDTLRGVAQHLEVCQECREEVDLLIEAYRRGQT